MQRYDFKEGFPHYSVSASQGFRVRDCMVYCLQSGIELRETNNQQRSRNDMNSSAVTDQS